MHASMARGKKKEQRQDSFHGHDVPWALSFKSPMSPMSTNARQTAPSGAVWGGSLAVAHETVFLIQPLQLALL